jgi:hypothetical protein
MNELFILGFILYVLERLVTAVATLLQVVAEAALTLVSAYVVVTLFATRRLIEWAGEQLPEADIPDHWYLRMAVAGVLFPLVPWLVCRVVGIPTSWILVAALAVHGLLWGVLATEEHTVLSFGNGDDSFPLNL